MASTPRERASSEADKGYGRPPLGWPAWGWCHLATGFVWMALIAPRGRSFWRLLNRHLLGPSGLLGARRPASGGLSVLRCTVTLLSDHGSILDRVYVEYLTMAQVGFSFGYGSKPFGSKLYISVFSPLKWLGFCLYVTLVKSHAKVPPEVCRSAGFGPSGPDNVCFGSNLDMLSLKSNSHQTCGTH